MELPAVITLDWLREGYLFKRLSPEAVMAALLDRIDRHDQPQAWITRQPRNEVLAYARRVAMKGPKDLPLFGVPFAIKDNIDLAGVPTTAACPAYAYTPEKSAFVVEKLIAAGAIPIGKTNLDQFATGLVGTRTPFGACHSVFSPQHISGGSSSGSAVVVAAGLVSFALGTDTAGSGRIPAAFNNLVGWKPSKGLLSIRGVVPACKSLDCVSVFSLSAADCDAVRRVVSVFDGEDAFSRPFEPSPALPAAIRLGVPRADQLQWFDDNEMLAAWEHYLEQIKASGIELQEIDFTPFRDTAKLLYEGPWLAERYAAVGEFIENHPAATWPTTRVVIQEGKCPSAVDAFRADYRRLALKRAAEKQLADITALLMPTAGRHFKLSEIEQEPLRHNTALGTYTNFMNLLDLAAVAVPAGFREDGLPFGITLCAAAGQDENLLQLADQLHQQTNSGAGVARQTPLAKLPSNPNPASFIRIAVCGAHLSGLPLNTQLLERDAVLEQTTRTSADYQLFALPNTTPPKPGMVKTPDFNGPGIEIEIWKMPTIHFGSFVAGIPAPLGIGRITCADGDEVMSFLCEAHAVNGALDITEFGGWKSWLASKV